MFCGWTTWACWPGLNTSWAAGAETGAGWKVCKTLLLGERRTGAGPEELEETIRLFFFFLLLEDSLEEDPGEDDFEDDPLLALLGGLLCSRI